MAGSIRIRFIVELGGTEAEAIADAAQPIANHDGDPGSLLQIAMQAGVHIEHACGGVGACGTCHVIVEQGLDQLAPPDEAEEDMLDQVAGLTSRSRLACRAVPLDGADLRVRVPAWNRNA